MSYNKKSRAKCLADMDFLSALENLLHTTPRWASEWYSVCCAIFEADTQLATQYRKDEVNQTFYHYSISANDRPLWYYNGKEIWANGQIDLMDWAVQKCYLFRFYDENDILVFSKVGTATGKVIERLKAEMRDYEQFGVVKAIIDRVYNCGDYPAQGFESLVRNEYIQEHPTAFMKNDRFAKVAFSLTKIDELYRASKYATE
jgi:hypothetical protein